MVPKRFKRGDHVSRNSEAGRGIKSDTTDHVAMHKESALSKFEK